MDSTESKADYRALLHASPNAYLLLTPELVIVDANQAYTQLTGRHRQSLLGRTIFDAFPRRESHSARQLEASFARVLQARCEDLLPLLHYPIEVETDAGRTWQDRYWSVSSTPLFGEEGNVALILHHVSDVTELLHARPPDEDRVDYRLTRTAHRINEALESERRRMRQLMEQAPGFVAVGRGPNFVFELANNAYYQLVGHREILGKPVREALPELEGQGFFELLEQVYATGEAFVGRAMPIQVQHEPGAELAERYIDFIYQPILEADGTVSGIFVQGHDVTEAHELSRQIGYQAAHDSLTGLVNRREFEQQLMQAIESLDEGSMHSLLYLDLDQFKVVNDTCGHSAGDELLRLVSMLLNAELRPTDTLARLGGDEFGVLLKNCPETTAERIANQLRERISDVEFSWEGRIFGCGVSIGVTAFDNSSTRLETILSAADSACFLGKEKGRNRVQVYRPEDDELTARRREMDWIGRLREALHEERILLYAQRIEPLASERNDVSHLELLVRLQDLDGSLVPPMAFIPAAERYGLMPMIDRYVIRKAFDYLRALPSQQRRRMHLAINLSGATLNDEDFLPFVEEQVRTRHIMPEQICFEVTETAAVKNLTRTAELMRRLKSLGFFFALDDFGSGMSSFGYLKTLPVDLIKIDGIFIKHILEDNVDAVMVQSIARVAEVMGIRTVAEYVENDEVRRLLVKLGVDYGQGYGIHKPEALGNVSRETGTLDPVD